NRCRTSSQHRRRQLKKRVTPAGVAFILYTLRRAGFTLNEIDEMPASHAFQFLHCALCFEGVETRFAFQTPLEQIQNQQIKKMLST
ncbi:MAG: hypothetical protein IKW49_05155, partial [Opitutales bacterium]|nr:hypothetical protein [Opitutales bacterium]